ncbi:NB-ARC domain-containing protein [Micromonospora parva]|uniref:NB-ARC domain-containing protein n=1 Tax=Micromonospora parva TaxID=1464048 RepID=UPI0033E1243F
MRGILDRYVLEYISDEDALGNNFDKANLRRAADDRSASLSISAFLDLQEAYDVLNRHREVLPEELGTELRKNTALLNQLVPIRNRVMHGRPLQPSDAENAVASCSGFTTRYWKAVKETLDHLAADPAWEPAFERQAKRTEKILHNLPLPEYDETGLFGRSTHCKKVASYLLKRREPIITITGEGGIGKTALALEVANNVLDDPDSPYECILWVSLKTERLTANGVVEISGAVADITGAASALGRAVVNDFAGSTADLAEMLDGIETLLVIDNLETVNGAEVLSLYETLPPSVTFLFTSRVGIGQFERKIELGPLEDRDADSLFRRFAKERGVERFATLKPELVRQIVSQLRNSPLAIRWYLLSVAAGERPDLALSSQEILLEFCVRSVYERMDVQPKVILGILFALDRDTSFDELAILTDILVDDLRRAVHSLLNGSMVNLEPDSKTELVSRIRLTEAARGFLRKVEPPQGAFVEQVLRRELEFRKSDEHRRADQQARQLAPNSVRVRSDFDKPTAHLLRLALLASRKSGTGDALKLTEKARSLNPEYWEVDRVEAFIASSAGQVEQATALYRSALRKADGEESAAVIAYYFAGHLARKAHDVETGIEFARQAHEHFDTAETAQQLGSMLVWGHEIEEGQEYLISAFEEAEDGRLRLIALTGLVDSWTRWAERLWKIDKRPLEAARSAYTGFSLGAREVAAGTVDVRLTNSLLESAYMLIRVTTSAGVESEKLTREVEEAMNVILTHRTLFLNAKLWVRLPGFIGMLLRHSRVALPVKALCTAILRANEVDVAEPGVLGEVLIGRVSAWRGTFGFISHPRYPDGVFFPASAIEGLLERGENIDLKGQEIQFSATPSDKDARPRADWVRLAIQGGD